MVVEQVAGYGHTVAGHGGRADGTGEADLGDAWGAVLEYVLVVVQVMNLIKHFLKKSDTCFIA